MSRLVLVPVILTAALSGCQRGGEAQIVPLQTSTTYPQSTVRQDGSQSFLTQFDEWLRNGTTGSSSVPSPLEIIVLGAGQ